MKPAIITLIGGEVTLQYDEVYVEQGAIAINGIGEDVTADIQYINSVAEAPDTYYLVYRIDDEGGTSEVTRKVIREYSTLLPVLTINGGDETIGAFEIYSDQGATAVDHLGNNVSQHVEVHSMVPDGQGLSGEYIVLYRIADYFGGYVEDTRTVTILPLTLDEGKGVKIGELSDNIPTRPEVEVPLEDTSVLTIWGSREDQFDIGDRYNLMQEDGVPNIYIRDTINEIHFLGHLDVKRCYKGITIHRQNVIEYQWSKEAEIMACTTQAELDAITWTIP